MIESTNHIYRGTGVCTDRILYTEGLNAKPLRLPTIADLVPAIDIMTRNVMCATMDLQRDALVRLMLTNHVGCVPVIDEHGRPLGMVTKLDLVEQLLAIDAAQPPEEAAMTAGQLMMPVALTLGEHATVVQAATLMCSQDVHHVPIVDSEQRLIGIISSMDIVHWLAVNDGYQPH